MFRSNRLFIVLLIAALLLVVPFAVSAQSTDEPSPTLEATLVAPSDEQPPPVVVVDQSQIPTWAVVIILVLVLGVVSVAYAGIVNSAKQAPEWTREILLSIAGSGLDSVGKYVKATPTPMDDMAYDELRKLYDQLRADLLATNQKMEALSRGSSGSG